jgi:hypothetical protein
MVKIQIIGLFISLISGISPSFRLDVAIILCEILLMMVSKCFELYLRLSQALLK